MSGPTRHTLHAHQSHHGWNNEFPPLLTIAPGEAVEFEIRDASGGQITERSGRCCR
jgi:formamidase